MDDVPAQLRLWFWMITSERTGRRVKTTWRMTEEDARQRHGADAVKVEASLEVHTLLGHTSAFQHGR